MEDLLDEQVFLSFYGGIQWDASDRMTHRERRHTMEKVKELERAEKQSRAKRDQNLQKVIGSALGVARFR